MANLLRMGKHMNKLHELMVITMEECGELTQACSKIIRKYKDIKDIESTQRTKLIDEVGDVYCMIELMRENGLISWDQILDRSDVKRKKLKQWSSLIKDD